MRLKFGVISAENTIVGQKIAIFSRKCSIFDKTFCLVTFISKEPQSCHESVIFMPPYDSPLHEPLRPSLLKIRLYSYVIVSEIKDFLKKSLLFSVQNLGRTHYGQKQALRRK
jgi:hypothetical protein